MNMQTAKSVSWRSTGAAAVLARAPRLRRSRINRGQSMEFAMISIVALLLMVVGIQYALLRCGGCGGQPGVIVAGALLRAESRSIWYV